MFALTNYSGVAFMTPKSPSSMTRGSEEKEEQKCNSFTASPCPKVFITGWRSPDTQEEEGFTKSF